MNRSFTRWSVAITGLVVLGLTSQLKADNPVGYPQLLKYLWKVASSLQPRHTDYGSRRDQ